jgi:hypothetical protein
LKIDDVGASTIRLFALVFTIVFEKNGINAFFVNKLFANDIFIQQFNSKLNILQKEKRLSIYLITEVVGYIICKSFQIKHNSNFA